MSARKQERQTKSESDFFHNVYEVVRLIPVGRVTSYGAIASYLGSKRGARMVGWALGNSYLHEGVPAHRVVNKAGVLTAKLLFETPTTMEDRLADEGVEVSNDQIQNLDKYFWDPDKELS